jgi:methionine sulfoxide reductase heme-binding subunit
MTKNSAKYGFWAVLTMPAAAIAWRYATGSISYGQVMHETGDWSVGLLAVALSATPLRNALPGLPIGRWILAHRRALGVASFAYAAIHTLSYVQRKWGYGYLLEEAKGLDLLTGWIALVIFMMLAITSNDRSLRVLGRNWQRLHRCVYVGAGLVFTHWILTAFSREVAYRCLIVVCLVQALRFFPRRRALGSDLPSTRRS